MASCQAMPNPKTPKLILNNQAAMLTVIVGGAREFGVQYLPPFDWDRATCTLAREASNDPVQVVTTAVDVDPTTGRRNAVFALHDVEPGPGYTIEVALQRRVGDHFELVATYARSNVEIAPGTNTVHLDRPVHEGAPVAVSTAPTRGAYVKTIGLGGSAARFQRLGGLVVTPDGEVLVVDGLNIRRITEDASGRSSVSTLAGHLSLAGFADGIGETARFRSPSGVALGPDGSLFVADGTRVRRIARQPSGQAIVTTIAGSETAGHRDGPGKDAEFTWLSGITATDDGKLVVVDIGSMTLRVVEWNLDQGARVSTLMGADGPLRLEPTISATLAAGPGGRLMVATRTRVFEVLRGGQGVASLAAVAGSAFGYADGPGATARFSRITAMAVERENSVLIADAGNSRIRRVVREEDGQVTVSTLVDSSVPNDYPSQSQNLFSQMGGLAIRPDGRLLVTNGPVISQLSGLETASPAQSTYAGHPQHQFVPQNGPGTSRTEFLAEGMAVHRNGDVFLTEGHRIMRLTVDELGRTTVTPIAGASEAGYLDGEGDAARFRSPRAVAFDRAGRLLVFDAGNLRIRRLTFDGGAVRVETLAGTGAFGSTDGPALAARLHDVRGFTVAECGDVFFTDRYRVRKLGFDASGHGIITTLAGSPPEFGIDYLDGPGTVARFGHLGGLAWKAPGELFVADQTHHVIRKVAIEPSGGAQVTTYAGGGGNLGSSETISFADGLGVEAAFFAPNDVLVTPNGDMLVADSQNHRIRRITEDGTNVWVSTLSGGAPGFVDGPLNQARFFVPRKLAMDSSGALYVFEGGDMKQVRKVVL